MPSDWVGIESSDVLEILDKLSPDETMIDWRFVIIAGMSMGPCDNLDEIIAMVRSLANTESGTLSRELYEKLPLWFNTTSAAVGEFDRGAALTSLFWRLVAGESGADADAEELLLYMCGDNGVGKGFEKALSVLADDTGAVGIKEISRALNWGKDPAQSQGDIGFVKDAWKRMGLQDQERIPIRNVIEDGSVDLFQAGNKRFRLVELQKQ